MVKRRLKQLEDAGYMVYRFMPVMNGMGQPGMDFYTCIEGRFIAIETKAPGKRLTQRQHETAKSIARAGGAVFVVGSQAAVDECFDAMMRQIDHNRNRSRAWKRHGKIDIVGKEDMLPP